MLPTCDHDRYRKSHHGIANGANDDGRVRQSDAVSEQGNENVSAVSASANAVDARDKERT
jgi:hypothetical protein